MSGILGILANAAVATSACSFLVGNANASNNRMKVARFTPCIDWNYSLLELLLVMSKLESANMELCRKI